MPTGYDPPKIVATSGAESVIGSATDFDSSSGKITTPNGDYQLIVGVDANSELKAIAIQWGTASQDNLPRFTPSEAQWDAMVDAVAASQAAEAELDPDSLISG